MNKKILIPTVIVFVLGLIYLAWPAPQVPDLNGGVRSDEPGDTWQHPDQKAFYTNRKRGDVLSEMQSKFSFKILGITIPSYRLNYRPEEASEFVRDQLPTYYLEEIVYPFRESLFVNGWEPSNSPMFTNWLKKDIPEVTFKGVTYLSKVTLRPVYSSVWGRILVWILIFPTIYLTYFSLKRSLKNG